MARGDRILANLPRTFAVSSQPSALGAITDAFGGELLDAERSLAAVMFAHWVDTADVNASAIDDLARIASLYAVAPRDDETIEEFRARLVRHVRTFIEGPTTTRGVLRIAAEVLGLVIADGEGQIETWWDRAGPLTTTQPAGDDAATLLFGVDSAVVRGRAAAPAGFLGTNDILGPVELGDRRIVRLSVNGGAAVAVTLPDRADLDAIVTALNTTPGISAEARGSRLFLATRSVGSANTLDLGDDQGDAVPALLGIAPHEYFGSGAAPAQVTGIADLSAGVDLRQRDSLALAIDGDPPVTVHCAGQAQVPQYTLAGEIARAINTAFPQPVATHNGAHVTLTSPLAGPAGRIRFLTASEGDALDLIFGFGSRHAQGADAVSASLTGIPDLSANSGAPPDLGALRRIQIAIDDAAPVIVDFAAAGIAEAGVRPAQIVDAINAALGRTAASTDGSNLVLSSAEPEEQGAVAIVPIETVRTRRFVSRAFPRGEAADTIFGVFAAEAQGADATAGQLLGAIDLHDGIDLRTRRYLRLALDGAAPQDIDCASNSPRPRAALLDEIVGAINARLGTGVASVATGRLVLTARSTGAASRIALSVVDDFDAAPVLLGAAVTEAGSDSVPARLVGTADLSRSVDLSQRSVLRIAFDGGRAIDVDVVGAAPDRTFGEEIVAKLNAAQPRAAALDSGGHLVLSSSITGAESRVSLLPLRSIELVEYPAGTASFEPQIVANGGHFPLTNDGAADSTVSFTLASPGGLSGVALIGLTTGARISIAAITGPGETLTLEPGPDGQIVATRTGADGASRRLPADQILATPAALAAVVPFADKRPLATNEPGTRPSLALVDPLAGNGVLLESLVLPPPSATVAPAAPSAASAAPTAPQGRLELLGVLHAAERKGDLRDGSGVLIASLRAAGGIDFAPFDGRMVLVQGQWYPAPAPLLVVDAIAQLFDVCLGAAPFDAVAVDAGAGGRSLAAQLAGADLRQVIAREFTPAEALCLPRGRSDWLVLACDAARFGTARFDSANFAGPPCAVVGVFDAARFAPAGTEQPHFAPFGSDPQITLGASWQSHQAGAFTVNLPADLPARFGARFNEARFTTPAEASETYKGVVLDPPSDTYYLPAILPAPTATTRGAISGATSVTFAAPVWLPTGAYGVTGSGISGSPTIQLTHGSASGVFSVAQTLASETVLTFPQGQLYGSPLVYTEYHDFVPLGWEPQRVPFVQPRTRTLTGGAPGVQSALYLVEPEVAGAIGILAREPGAWGDEIAITVRYAGPAIFDLTVAYAGARFECGRAIVLSGSVAGGDTPTLPALVGDLLKPGPIGVMQTKAAGVRVKVTRERT